MALRRTPPNTSKLTISASQQASSEGDLSKLDPENSLNYVGRRPKPKRLRKSEDSESDDTSIKEELLSMLSTWKKEQDTVFKKLCSDIAELKKQNSKIQSTSDELEKSIKFVSLQYDDLKDKLIKENLTYISSLENKIEEMQKRDKFTVIEFKNLPQLVKLETQQEMCDVVISTCAKIEVPIQISDIKDIFRTKNRTGNSTVVTNLTSVLTRDKILNGAKEFNKKNPHNKLSSMTIGRDGPPTPIFVTESLTYGTRKLFGLTREVAKTLNYKFCWTRRGNIFVKKTETGPRIQIRNEADLETLKKK